MGIRVPGISACNFWVSHESQNGSTAPASMVLHENSRHRKGFRRMSNFDQFFVELPLTLQLQPTSFSSVVPPSSRRCGCLSAGLSPGTRAKAHGVPTPHWGWGGILQENLFLKLRMGRLLVLLAAIRSAKEGAAHWYSLRVAR